MPLAVRATRLVRLTLDLLLLALIAFVLAMLVLARGIPLVTGGQTFIVGGASMEPSIPMGAAVHVEPVAAGDLRPGDVVSIQVGPEQSVFTHRIVRIAELPDGTHLETKGDANEGPDPSLVPASAVIGRMTISVPYAGFGLALLSSMQGVLFLVALAGVLLAAAWLLESIEEDHHEARAAAYGHAERIRHTAAGAFAGGSPMTPVPAINDSLAHLVSQAHASPAGSPGRDVGID